MARNDSYLERLQAASRKNHEMIRMRMEQNKLLAEKSKLLFDVFEIKPKPKKVKPVVKKKPPKPKKLKKPKKQKKIVVPRVRKKKEVVKMEKVIDFTKVAAYAGQVKRDIYDKKSRSF